MSATMEPHRQNVQTTRFGPVDFAADEVIDFPWGIPGLDGLHQFLALSLADQPNFVWLQSLEEPSVALPACDPWQVFPDYEPRLPGYATLALHLENPDDFTILCIVVVTENAQTMTMNLMAPIVVNLKQRRARQVVLENSGYSVRAAVPRRPAETAKIA